MSERKQFKKPFNKKPSLSTEQKIEGFIIRNSKNGYFTKITTIPYKFEISEDRSWDIVGELLVDGKIESTHDLISGEMKLCENGRTYQIMDLERKRKNTSKKNFKKSKKQNS